MDFTKSFSDILNIVEDIFNEAHIPTYKMYSGTSEWDKLHSFITSKGGLEIHSGLTKFVIELTADNFVIKIPFSGYTRRNGCGELENEDYSVNHCEREVELYNKLKDTEIGDLLVPTYFIGKVNELEVYIQPKVEPYDYFTHSPSEKSYNIANELDEYECTADDEDCVAAFVEYFGDQTEHILSMLDELGVRDVHSANFGYQNGGLVIFDYSGYHC